MRYLLGVAMSERAPIWQNLHKIPGIGRFAANEICHQLTLMPKSKWGSLTPKQATVIEQFLNKHRPLLNLPASKVMDQYSPTAGLVGPEFIREKEKYRDQRIKLGTRKGKRIAKGMPVNGQKTRSNAKTAKKLKGH